MKKLAALVVILLFAFSAASAQSLTAAERSLATKHLEATRDAFLKSLDNLSDEQWNWKSAPERWSVAECAEHIVLSEDLIYGLITERILKSPAAPEKKEEVRGKDEAVLKIIPDRSQKFQAPEPIQPKHVNASREELVKRFKDSRARLIEFVQNSPEEMRSHFGEHPVMKLLDAYQWVLLDSAHTERHTTQIAEVKADSGFPKK